MTVVLPFTKLAHAAGLPDPAYQTAGSAGADLCAAIPPDQPVTLKPGARALVPTGIALALPHGLEGQVRPRSGLAARFGITVLNAPGTIDSDFRGEISVILINLGQEDFTVKRGDRIAQLVVSSYISVTLLEVSHLDQTGRGVSGFGSTGIG